MSGEKLKVADVVAAIQATRGTVYMAARQLRCSPNTVYNYVKRHPAVREALDGERGLLIDTAELALYRAVQNGEPWAVSLTLKTLGKPRGYVERQEVTGADGGPIHHVSQSELDRDIDSLLAEMARREEAGFAGSPPGEAGLQPVGTAPSNGKAKAVSRANH